MMTKTWEACDDMGSGDDDMVCYDMSTHMVLFEYYEKTCEVTDTCGSASSGPSDDMEDMEKWQTLARLMLMTTHSTNPLSATITGFAPVKQDSLSVVL